MLKQTLVDRLETGSATVSVSNQNGAQRKENEELVV